MTAAAVLAMQAGLANAEITAFRDRPLADAAFPSVFLDATFCKARTDGDRRRRGSRVTAQAVVKAIGISAGLGPGGAGSERAGPFPNTDSALRPCGRMQHSRHSSGDLAAWLL